MSELFEGNSPDALDAVFAKNRIGRNDRTIFQEGLGSEQAVEWVTVVERECRDSCHVTEIDREMAKLYLDALNADADWVRSPRRISAANSRGACRR